MKKMVTTAAHGCVWGLLPLAKLPDFLEITIRGEEKCYDSLTRSARTFKPQWSRT